VASDLARTDPRAPARAVTGIGIFYWTSGLHVDSLSPRYVHVWLSRYEGARQPVDHIEEAILWRLNDYLALAALDVQIQQH
jgi:hypothetical protein